MEEKLKNIVILRTDRIGEVLLSTVAVDAVRERYPEARITFVTSGYSRDIVEGRPGIEDIIVCDTVRKGNVFIKAFKLFALLRKGRFDAAVVLNPHKALHLACYMAGIPERIGYDRKWGELLTRKIKDERAKGEKHEVEYTADLLRLLDPDIRVSAPRLAVDRQAEERVEKMLADKGMVLYRPLVVVHPGSSNPAKMWPAARYAELIKKLKEEIYCDVGIIGGEEERDLVRKIITEADEDVADMTGALGLKELAAFIKKARLFIGNDAGPMHMAAALDVPVLAIFGRNIAGAGPVRWRPWGDGNVVIHENPGCSPCGDASCANGYRCMDLVTVEKVFGAAKEMLRDGRE
ncbi:MAG: lipopolysaccharide heptosyltransferase II [Candidatus Omnitrophota bacterium]